MSDTHDNHSHDHEPANLPTLEIPKAGEHHDLGSHRSHSHGTSTHVSTHNDHGDEESQPSLVATVLRFLIVAVILIGLFVLLWWLSRTLISSRGRTTVADTNVASTQTDIRNAFSGTTGGSPVPDTGSPVLGTSTTAFPDPVVTPPAQTPAAIPPPQTPVPQVATTPATTYYSPNGGYYLDVPSGWYVDSNQSSGDRTVLQSPAGSGYVEAYDNRSGETLDSVTRTLYSSPDVYDISPTNVYGVPATYFRSGGNRSGIVVVNGGRIYYLRGILSTGSHVAKFHFQ